MKAARPLLPLVLVAATGLTACGLGTEVGNGVRPKGQSGGGAPGGAAKADQPEGAPDNTTTASTGNPAAPATPGTVTADGNTTAAAGAATTPATSWQQTTGFDFDLSILTATCASPLGEGIASPVTLAKKATDGTLSDKLTFTADANGTWSVTDKAGTLLRKVVQAANAQTAFGVSATDASGQQVPSNGATCDAPIVRTGVTVPGYSGTVTETTVEVKLGVTGALALLTTTITWDLAPPATAGGKPQLVQVVITGAADYTTGPITLTAQ